MNEIASPHCQPDNAILLSVSRGQGHIDEVSLCLGIHVPLPGLPLLVEPHLHLLEHLGRVPGRMSRLDLE